MEQLKIKLAGVEDAERVVKWINGTPGNLFDPDILTYPTLRILCSYNDKPVAYLPTQRALFIESIAVDPQATLPHRAQAVRDLVKGAQLLASGDRIREIYFLSTDQKAIRVAEGHGFERIPYTLLRMKV